MLEVTSLLFHTNKNNQISFDKDTKSTKDVSVSEYSFQKTLESYQGNRLSENAVEKTNTTQQITRNLYLEIIRVLNIGLKKTNLKRNKMRKIEQQMKTMAI